MKVVYFNDTGKEINIHPATLLHGTKTSNEPIKPLEERVFELPEGTYPWIKMWDHNGQLSIFVSGKQDDEQEESLDEEYDDEDEYYEEYEEDEEYGDYDEDSDRARRIKGRPGVCEIFSELGGCVVCGRGSIDIFYG